MPPRGRLSFKYLKLILALKQLHGSLSFHRDVGEPLYLTPYIQSGDIATAKSLAQVTDPLPDLENENIESYAGFLTVEPSTNNNMFFWFFPATVFKIYLLALLGLYTMIIHANEKYGKTRF